MFNYFLSAPELAKMSFVSFFLILLARQICFKSKIYALFYYGLLVLIIFIIGAIAGGGIINDAYDRLAEFKRLEESQKLAEAKHNPEAYHPQLQIDLQQFEDSQAFKQYIQNEYEAITDKAEAMSIGLLFAIICEITLVCSLLVKSTWRIIYQKRFFKSQA